MPYTDPGAVTTGTTITSTWGNAVRTAEQFLANPPQCRVYNSAAISIAVSGTAQALTFNSERFDTDTMHDTVTNPGRITFKTAGAFHCWACVEFAANATGYRQIYFRKNGATIIAVQSMQAPPATVGGAMNLSVVYKFAVNDYIECFAAQSSGGALNVVANLEWSPEFGATYVGLG